MKHEGAEQPKTMLILKANPASLATSEMFLRNRGWIIYSTTDVKEALLLLVKQQYSYILISVDHSNKKTQMLPKLIAHKFKIGIMTFAETQSANSYNLLSASNCEYKVYAPVTGPAIERCVMKYIRDRRTPQLFIAQPNLPEASVQSLKGAKSPSARVFVKSKKSSTGFGSVHVTNLMGSEDPGKVRKHEDPEYKAREDTLIARATEKSLIGNVEILDGWVKNKVHHITKSGCIVVESNHFSGYLVAALGTDKKIEETFISNLKTTLFKFLRDNGEDVSENVPLSLSLKPVDFEPWALEYADFLRKSVHRGDEVAVAFFPRKPVNVTLEDSDHPTMAKVKLNDLQGDRQVEFDLYIHLANNNKYVLYTPQGGVFYTKQLNRLKRQGITHMHVKKDSVNGISKYNAQSYINDLVDDYVEKHRGEQQAPQAI